MDDASLAAMGRYEYLTAGDWRDHFRVGAYAWVVPVEHRVHYTDFYPISLVKGFRGETADVSLEL